VIRPHWAIDRIITIIVDEKNLLAHAQNCLTRPGDGTTFTDAARAEKARASLWVRESGQLRQRDVSCFARSGTPIADQLLEFAGKKRRRCSRVVSASKIETCKRFWPADR
jgi:hypothetical protein